MRGTVAVAVLACLLAVFFLRGRLALPVSWQYDWVRQELREEAKREAERQAFLKTNTASYLVTFGSSVLTWRVHPNLQQLDVELGYRVDGVVVWRRPPENLTPILTNSVPLL